MYNLSGSYQTVLVIFAVHPMLISLNTEDSLPLVEQIVTGMQRQIDERVLRQGARAPSIRQFADEHGVSRFTVVQAYDRLVAAGYLESRRGSGFYVSRPVSTYSMDVPSCQLDRAMDVLWLVQRSTQDYQMRYQPGCGWLPSDWHDAASLERALRSVARSGAQLMMEGYGNAQGYVPLRQDIQQRLVDIGIGAELDQIVTTHGVSSSVDLVARYLLKPGDTVFVDDPGYFHFFGHLQALGANLVGVPRTLEGPDTDALAVLLQEHKPKAFFTTTVLHNPTGVSISQACAYRVLRLAEEYDFMIIEDDVYGDLQATASTRLATLDQLNKVIYVNGFSKTISARLRVGYLVACRELVQDLVDFKLLTGITSSELGERVVHQILLEGHYRKHLAKLHVRLHAARESTLNLLERYGLTIYTEPQHGMFIWARFAELDESAVLATYAAEHEIMLAAGNIFRPHQAPSPWLRFNMAYSDEPKIFERLTRKAEQLVASSVAEF